MIAELTAAEICSLLDLEPNATCAFWFVRLDNILNIF
jgi:hypothetical protein